MAKWSTQTEDDFPLAASETLIITCDLIVWDFIARISHARSESSNAQLSTDAKNIDNNKKKTLTGDNPLCCEMAQDTQIHAHGVIVSNKYTQTDQVG